MRIRDVFRAVGWIICTLIPGRGVREADARGAMLGDRLAAQDFHPDLAPTAAGDPVGAGPAAVSVPPTPPAAGHFHPDVMVFDEVCPGAVGGEAGRDRGLMPVPGPTRLQSPKDVATGADRVAIGAPYAGFSASDHLGVLIRRWRIRAQQLQATPGDGALELRRALGELEETALRIALADR